MIQSKTQISVQEILQKDAESVLIWLKNMFSENSLTTQDFNWLLLADSAAFNAQENFDITWAEVATKIYDYLAVNTEQKKIDTQESLMISSMMLRARMISQLGIIKAHPVLDINLIFQWFLNNQNLSYHQVEQKSENWQVLSVDEIKELRRLKNRLKVIEVIHHSHKYVLAPEFKEWLDLRHKLP